MKNNALNNKEKVIEFIKNNPAATYKEIRKNTKLHPERVFKGGMAEIYREANIQAPRNFERNTKEERKRLISNLIKKNPKISSFQITKELKINVSSAFRSIKEAYKLAGIKYPRDSSYRISPNKKRNEIIRLIKENPEITWAQLEKITKIRSIHRLFKNFEDIYKEAGIKFINGREKIKNRKIKSVIEYIKNNPLATQRQINKACKTHVQKIFNKGIIEAYEKSGIKYPFERRKLHGTALNEIKNRAKRFEEEIAIKLSGFGTVNKLVKTKRGIADIILERKNKKVVIEIKDYQLKEISIAQINQLNKYLEDINSDTGILVCHKKPKKDKFLIGKNRIFILEEQELNKIPDLI